jgi:hypothetical protein
MELFEYWGNGDFAPPHFLLRQIAIFLGARKPARSGASRLNEAEQYAVNSGPVRQDIPAYARAFIEESKKK